MSATKTGRVLVQTGTPGWFEDKTNPGKKTRKQEGDTIEAASPKPESKEKQAPTYTLPTGKLTRHPTVQIKCADCGKGRRIQVQDKHQVTRCTDCQRQHRNKRRRERRQEAKEKKA